MAKSGMDNPLGQFWPLPNSSLIVKVNEATIPILESLWEEIALRLNSVELRVYGVRNEFWHG